MERARIPLASADSGYGMKLKALPSGALVGVLQVVLEDVGEVVGPFLVDRPSAELDSLVFIVLSETDTCLLREANQRDAEKAYCNDEEQSGAIRVL
jgi:hypothetical protein